MAGDFVDNVRQLRLRTIIFKALIQSIFLVQGFAWTDATRELLDYVTPKDSRSPAMGFVVAGASTAFSVLAVAVLLRGARFIDENVPIIEIVTEPKAPKAAPAGARAASA